MDYWLKQKLEEAKGSLHEAGIPHSALSHIRIRSLRWMSSRACVFDGGNTVFLWTPWTYLAQSVPYIEDSVVPLIRHEIGHILVHRYPGVAKEFGLKGYPDMGFFEMAWITLTRGYGATCDEEGLCENIKRLDNNTLRRLGKVLKRSRA